MPMSTGGNFAIQGIKSCRDKRLRYTIVPLSSIPTACNTRFAISIPRTCISCFIGLASCGSIGSRIVLSLWLIEVDPHRGGNISLRPGAASHKKWERVTPAMAAGLPDHVWTMEELLSYRVPPDFRDRLDQQATN